MEKATRGPKGIKYCTQKSNRMNKLGKRKRRKSFFLSSPAIYNFFFRHDKDARGKIDAKCKFSCLPGAIFIHEEDDGPGLGLGHELLHGLVKVLLLGVPFDLGRDGDADALPLGQGDEGGDALLAVLSLGRHRAHVGPPHGLGDLHHGLGLEVVGRHDPGKVLEAGLVGELGRRRRVADLRDLK